MDEQHEIERFDGESPMLAVHAPGVSPKAIEPHFRIKLTATASTHTGRVFKVCESEFILDETLKFAFPECFNSSAIAIKERLSSAIAEHPALNQ